MLYDWYTYIILVFVQTFVLQNCTNAACVYLFLKSMKAIILIVSPGFLLSWHASISQDPFEPKVYKRAIILVLFSLTWSESINSTLYIHIYTKECTQYYQNTDLNNVKIFLCSERINSEDKMPTYKLTYFDIRGTDSRITII